MYRECRSHCTNVHTPVNDHTSTHLSGLSFKQFNSFQPLVHIVGILPQQHTKG